MSAPTTSRFLLGASVRLTASTDALPSAVSVTVQHEDGTSTAIPSTSIHQAAPGEVFTDYLTVQAGRHQALWSTSGVPLPGAPGIFDVTQPDLAFLDISTVREYLGTTSASDGDIFAAHRAERDAQADWCRIDPYTWQLREALLRRIARNLAARRIPTSTASSFNASGGGSAPVSLDVEIDRLEGPFRRAGFA